ncbi:hypothetical protein AYO41_00240 [Verrucomicrobia bacterium SCGC AG-212-E04]|nr:hypothetical protein AYO41_00240 [Verrucomicrobia bacterium SCGC AG-212-E04]
MKYEIWQSDCDRKWYWQARLRDQIVVTDGLGYATKQGTMQTICELKFSAAVQPEVVTERESLEGLRNIFTDTEAFLSLKRIPKK